MTFTTATIFVGNVGNDGTGDNLRTAFIKTNNNFGNVQAYMDQSTNNFASISNYISISSNIFAFFNRGVAVHNDLRVIGNLTVEGNTIVKDTYINVDVFATEDRVIISNTAPASSTTSGALQVTGGAGIQGDVYANSFHGPVTGTVTGTVSSLANHNSDDLAEGTNNRYWTVAREAALLNNNTGTVGAETAARIAGNAIVAGQIVTETAARIAGDAAQQADRIAGNAVIVSQLATETAARIAGDAAQQADRIAGNIALRHYVDTSDYLNLPPLAGVLSENFVPLYSDFKFSLGAANSYAFFLTNSQGFQVVYFHANTPLGIVKPFRAYRFVSTDEFIYDTEPVSVSFLNANEYVDAIYNMGTQFAFLSITNSSTTAVRRVLALTNGNNKSNTWTFYLDVTSITGGSTNVFLLQDGGGDRILRTTMGSTAITLDVYDNTKTRVRTQQLFSSSEVSNTDYTGSGKTVADTALPFGYNPWGTAFAFTWNKFTETFIMKAVGYYTYQQNGNTVGQEFGTTILWNIPRTWLVGGAGALANLIPIKPSGYRYHKLPDTTWSTATGGMGVGFGSSGSGASVTTDEYAKLINVGTVGTWDTKGFQISSFPYTLAETIASHLTPIYSKNVGIPDASPWSKSAMAYHGHIIDDNILFYGESVLYGSKTIAANFSTTQFTTAHDSNDTLKLNPVTSKVEDPSAVISNDSNSYGTTSVAGTPVAYSATPGRVLYIITVSGGSRVYTSTGFTIPAIPATIGGVSGVALAGNTVYNGVDGDKKFWSVVSGPAHQFYIAHYSSGAWNNIYGPFVGTEIATGNSARGDSANAWGVYNGTSCLTANGRFMHYIEIYVPGGAFFNILEFNVNSNTMTVHDWNKFTRTVSTTYSNISPWYGCSFGFSATLGYYCMISTEAHTSSLISSSRDIRTGASHTEDDWFAGGSGRYDINVSAEATVGLSIYLKSYPLFIGGYYNSIPDMVLSLPANTTSYVYAELLGDDRRHLVITSGIDYAPNSFTKVMIGSVVTNSEKVTSSTSYRISNGSVDVASLKSIVSSSATFADFKSAIATL